MNQKEFQRSLQATAIQGMHPENQYSKKTQKNRSDRSLLCIALCGLYQERKKLGSLVRFREREVLLVDLTAFIDIRVEVNLGGLDGRVPQILLDYPQVFRAPV